ncbi:hypothetical protein TBR22_A21280 [Luteitalea sp. TBR-22]|uniref:helix-turn-helix transcriptional regulator n=1 Tax=Luteitalea sp. TBR-22 TaxID=2802971 RepID=UPI001AFA39A5|nr:AraC family transcriptional regulator [Luteitalea sp. TBR-22]BCS32904.1 hypothetical protein TBR22_A21280 [Luteitalea sp. TBR-22]
MQDERAHALERVRLLSRPSDDVTELVWAAPARRRFPARLTGTVGLCVKMGPAHVVQAEGRVLDYPADALCVRAPSVVWACDDTGPSGFVSIDIDASRLPARQPRRMAFASPEAGRTALALMRRVSDQHQPPLARDEAVAALVALATTVLGGRGDPDPVEPRVRLERIRAFLHSTLDAPVSLADLARASGLHKDVLVRAFRRAYGIPPYRYHLLARVDRARVALSRGMLVADVATALGFADQAHLTRVFRRVMGMPPGAYRRRLHTGPAPRSISFKT